MSKKKETMTEALLALLVLLLIPPAIVLDGYVLHVLWGWFAVSALGVRPLAVYPAVGVSLLASFLTHQSIERKKIEDPYERTGDAIARLFARSLFFWVVGWAVHAFAS